MAPAANGWKCEGWKCEGWKCEGERLTLLFNPASSTLLHQPFFSSLPIDKSMNYSDLGSFVEALRGAGELRDIHVEVDPHLEIAEIADRVVKSGGPALL